ncbi:MAG: PD-(D/E)XK nuclease family protein [Bacteroidales bacterium]|nr:PD-(D/E)XK nuclease family protein [Bacteroidales bacterium]
MKIDELEKQLQEDTKCCPINRGWYQELGNDSVHHFQIPIDSIFPPKFHYELPSPEAKMVVHNESGLLEGLSNYIREKTKNIPEIEMGTGVDVVHLKEYTKSGDIQDVKKKFSFLFEIINPFVQEYKEQLSSITDIINSFAEVYQREKNKLPFSFNVIDELHINENGHSRVLAKLLQYKVNDKYTILESFINLLQSKCQCEINIKVDSPDISNERNRIDALIVEKGKYAIIIENKIYWAVDQDSQIDRYVDFVKNSGFILDESGILKNVFVVYLTQDGTKEVSNTSFNEARKKLGWKNDEEQGQFIPVNYKNDILPWLKNDVLPNCTLKEDLLSSGIKQYIDFLEGLLGLRNNQIILMNNMKDFLLEKCSINENDSIAEKIFATERMIQKTNDLQSVLSTYKNQLMSFVNTFCQITDEILKNIFPHGDWRTSDSTAWENGFIQIRSGKWDSLVHLEWYPISQKQLLEDTEYTLVLHVEGNCRYTIGPILQNKLQINKKSSERDINTYFTKAIRAPKPFALMTDDEKYVFLKDVYSDKDVIDIVNKVNNSYDILRDNDINNV